MSNTFTMSPIAGDVDIAGIAALLADPTRADFLLTLSDGRALPAGELARTAGVAPSTASAHLARLVESGLVAVERWGKHRYYRISSPALITAIEALAVIAPTRPVRSLNQSERAMALHFARTCYDHLAGYLGVALTQALVDQGIVSEVEAGYSVTVAGVRRLEEFGLDLEQVGRQLSYSPYHIDWSERYRHIAGPMAKALTARMFDLDWLDRVPSSRAVRLTWIGRNGLRESFGLDVSQR
jgi:DNA-binding transcriptional ArsR family regulator